MGGRRERKLKIFMRFACHEREIGVGGEGNKSCHHNRINITRILNVDFPVLEFDFYLCLERVNSIIAGIIVTRFAFHGNSMPIHKEKTKSNDNFSFFLVSA